MKVNSNSLSNYAQALSRSKHAFIEPTNDLKKALRTTKSSKSILAQVKNISIFHEAKAAKKSRKEAKELVKTAEHAMLDRHLKLNQISNNYEPESITLSREFHGLNAEQMAIEHLNMSTKSLVSALKQKAEQLRNSE